MKTLWTVLILSFVACSRAFAIPISLFSDTDTYVDRARDIVIAKCVSVPEQPLTFVDGLYPAEVEVLKTVKGDRKAGPLKIGTVYLMKPGGTYLLANSGGSAFGSDFLALPELSVVPLPTGFDLKQLEGKTPKQQVQIVFARHLYAIERQLAPLLEQQRLLRQAVKDKDDQHYRSNGKVKLGEIKQLATANKNSIISLELEAGPLQWSSSAPGKTGYFYFADHLPKTPDWEFAYTPAKTIAEFDGKPLEAEFYQRFSPSRDKQLGASGYGNSIQVALGQVVLARTSDDPETIYILQIHKQARHEAMTVRYTVVRK
ncbi:MAG: hypothetical protein CMJ48_02585 [Planctomycetaceae bacterium]|nr:hypothetical protein [Planctomycetaceae bacterium]